MRVGGWRADEVRAMQVDGSAWPRYELVDGELLVTPAPQNAGHQGIIASLLMMIGPYVRQHGIGRALTSPADISLDGASVVQPDLFVVPAGQYRPSVGWSAVVGLVLAVEVLSPSSARADRTRKRMHSQRNGVGEYWIVDLDARLVERWQPADERPEIVDGELAWQPDAAHEAVVLDLPALFADALGDG